MKKILLLIVGFTYVTLASAQLSVSVTSDTTLCVGDSMQLAATPSGGVPPYSYQWIPAAGLDNPFVANPKAAPGTETTYEVTVIDAGPDTSQAKMTLSLSDPQAMTMIMRDTVCLGDTTLLNVSIAPSACGLNATGCSGIAQTAQIGNSTFSSAYPGPYNGIWQDIRMLTLIRKSELNAMGITGGSIQEISYNIATKNSTGAFQNFSIRMGCTSSTDLTGGTWISGLPTVYSRSAYTTVEGWNSHTLDTEYNWDGESNLLIEVCYDMSTTVGQDVTYYTNNGYISCLYRYTSGVTGCNVPSPFFYSRRPDMKIKMCYSTPPTATVSWTPSTDLSDPSIFNPVATVNSDRIYTATVTNEFGCVTTDSIGVYQRAMSLSVVGDTSFCIGVDSAQLYVHSNIPGASFTWSPATDLSCTNCQAPVAKPGTATTYTVTGTSASCSDNGSVLVKVNPLPVTVAIGDTTICVLDSASLNAVGGISYSWSPATGLDDPNIQTPKAAPAADKIYTVTATSDSGCTFTDDVYVTVNGHSGLSLTAARDSVCAGDTTQLLGELSPAECGLNPGGCTGVGFNGFVGNGTNYSAYPGPFQGLYDDARIQMLYRPEELNQWLFKGGTISRIAFDVGFKNSTQPYRDFTVKMGCSPRTDLAGGVWETGLEEVYFAAGYNTAAGLNTIVLDTEYDWDGESSLIIEICFNNTSFTSNDATRYSNTGYISALYRYLNDEDECITTTAFQYTRRPDVRLTICYDQFTSSTIAWTPPGGLSDPAIEDPVATVSGSTDYIMTVDDGSGCLNMDTLSVGTAILDVTINNGATASICEGDDVSVTTTSNIASATYAWTPTAGVSDPASSAPVLSPLSTTTYTLTTTTAGCVDVDTFRVNVDPLPTANAGMDTMICNLGTDSVGLMATGGVNYLWQPGLGLDDSTIANPTAFPWNNTEYKVFVTSAAGCTAVDSMWVYVNTFPTMSPQSGRDPICAGDTTLLNVNLTSPQGLYNYSWTPAGGLSDPTSATPTATVPGTTKYYVTVDGTGTCVNTDSITVTTAALSITAGPATTICEGEYVQLVTTSNIKGASYQWTPTTGLPGCSNCPNPTANPTTTTTYTVTATSGSCTDVKNVTITVNQAPSITISGDTTICAGSTVPLSANASGGATYKWSPDTWLDNENSATPNASPNASTIYHVEVTTGAGCKGSEQVTVNVFLNEMTAMTDMDTICPGESAQLDAVVCNEIWDQFNTDLDVSKWQTVLGGEVSADCGSVTGDALYFNGGGVRAAVTNAIDLSQVHSVNFYLKYGSGNAPCNELEPGQEVVFEYSIDNGIHWDTIKIYRDLSWFASFRKVNEWLPSVARISTARLRWRQLFHTGANNDNWSVDDISFCVNNTGGVTYSWTPATSLTDPAIRNPISTTGSTITYTVEADDGNCVASSDVTIVYADSCMTSIPALGGNTGIAVYPNPTTGSFTVELSDVSGQEVNIEVRNMLGQVVWKSNATSGSSTRFEVDLGNHTDGVYMIHVLDADRVLLKKLLLQR